MYRGTTPTLEFVLPMETSLLTAIWVTISQNQRVIIDKGMNEIQTQGKQIRVRLSQEDTLKLRENIPLQIQVRVKTETGDALASEIISTGIGGILKDGEI